MSDSYLVHLPDGTEYGPVDRATLAAWRSEGRLPAAALVWPHGAPEWLSVEAALAPDTAANPAPSVTQSPTALAHPPAAGPKSAPAKKPAAPSAAPHPGAAPSAAAPSAAAPSAVARPGSGPAPKPAAAAAPLATPAAAAPTASAKPAASGAPSKAVARSATPPRAGAAHPQPVAATAQPAPASAVPAVGDGGAAPDAPSDHSTDTRPRGLSPYSKRGTTGGPAIDPALLRKLIWIGASIAVLLVLLVGLFALLRPFVARRWTISAVKGSALPERHIEDGTTGLVVDLPSGWFALRPDNPFVTTAGARLFLAQPALGAFGTVIVASRPRFLDALDAHLDELLQQRAGRRPGMREEGRSDVQLGRGRGRMVRSVWQDGPRPMVAATVAWSDGYEVLTLETWAPAEAGAEFSAQLETLCRGVRSSGELDARVAQAVDRLALDVPELSPDVLRLLVAERMSRHEGLEGVPSAALLMVSRGLDVLTPAESEEMRVIYQKVWEPVPETERERMAALLKEIRAGREVPPSDLLLLREALKTGMLALAPEQRGRLQQLSGRAVRRALSRP